VIRFGDLFRGFVRSLVRWSEGVRWPGTRHLFRALVATAATGTSRTQYSCFDRASAIRSRARYRPRQRSVAVSAFERLAADCLRTTVQPPSRVDRVAVPLLPWPHVPASNHRRELRFRLMASFDGLGRREITCKGNRVCGCDPFPRDLDCLISCVKLVIAGRHRSFYVVRHDHREWSCCFRIAKTRSRNLATRC
jgi:hypothetical protein